MCRKKYTQGIYSGEIRRKNSNAIDPGKEETFDTKAFCKKCHGNMKANIQRVSDNVGGFL